VTKAGAAVEAGAAVSASASTAGVEEAGAAVCASASTAGVEEAGIAVSASTAAEADSKVTTTDSVASGITEETALEACEPYEKGQYSMLCGRSKATTDPCHIFAGAHADALLNIGSLCGDGSSRDGEEHWASCEF
jgi:hypothetical protein